MGVTVDTTTRKGSAEGTEMGHGGHDKHGRAPRRGLLEADLCGSILSAARAVYLELGYGFLELVYQSAMVEAFRERGLDGDQGAKLPVMFHGTRIATFKPDFVVNGKCIVEIKALKTLAPDCEAQLLNYLRAGPVEVGLLINFGPTLGIKRFIYTNDRKAAPGLQR